MNGQHRGLLYKGKKHMKRELKSKDKIIEELIVPVILNKTAK